MDLTRLNVGKTIEMAFDDRVVETIPESKVVVLRDGKDLESELTARKKLPADLTFSLSRTPFGDVEVTVAKATRRG